MIIFHIILHPAVHILDFHIFITLEPNSSRVSSVSWPRNVKMYFFSFFFFSSLFQNIHDKKGSTKHSNTHPHSPQTSQGPKTVISDNKQLFPEPEWALSQQPMRPKAERAIDSEAMRARGIIVLVIKIQLVGRKYRDKTTVASKTRFSRHCFGFQSRRFSLLVGYNIQPSTQ